MKKIIKRILISTIATCLIVSASAVKASDDEEPKYPQRIDIPETIDVLVH